LCLAETDFLVSRWFFLAWQKKSERPLRGLFIRALIPFMRALFYNIIITQRPLFLIPSLWGLGLQCMSVWVENKYSVYNNLLLSWKTWTLYRYRSKTSGLIESGLLGKTAPPG
jgi:hypothetical protein